VQLQILSPQHNYITIHIDISDSTAEIIKTDEVIHDQHLNKSYLGIQYLLFLDSSCSLLFILGHICPSIFSSFCLLDYHLFIMYIRMSSNIEITGLHLASTSTLLNASVMLFTTVSVTTFLVNLDLDQNLCRNKH